MARRKDMPLSEMVVLGLLAERPAHGYELEQTISQRRLREWTPLGRSLVYAVLVRLQRREHVTAIDTPSTRGPAAQLCSLTDEGREALAEAVFATLAEDLLHPSRADVAMMFSGVLGADRLVAALEQRARRARQEQRRSEEARLRTRQWQGQSGSSDAWNDRRTSTAASIFDRFDTRMKAELEWCDRTLAHLRPERAQPAS